MIDHEYSFGKYFQERLLAFFLQDPERLYDLVEPQFFNSPILREICRVTKIALKDARHSKLDRHTLKELLKQTVGAEDSWSAYKETVKRLYKVDLGDREILYNEAFMFARESRYREALEACERDVTSKHYDNVHKRIDKLRTSLNGTGVGISIKDLQESLRKQMNEPPKEVEWDGLGFFPARATILFAGRKGEGKSYLLQALGKASRKGRELVKGLPIAKKPFLYLAREGTQELYDQRFRALEFDYRKESKKFCLWGPWMEPIPPKILDPGAPYRSWAKEFGPCAIGIDGLRRFFDGDENSSEAMDPVGQELTAWANNGATVYVVHHRGKGKNIDSRGSSAIEDFVSVQYVVEALREGQRITKIRVRCVKNWYGEERALLLVPHWDGDKFWFTGGEDTEAQDRWAGDKEKVLAQTSVSDYVSRTAILKTLEGKIGRDRIVEILDSESGKNGKLRARRSSKPGAPFEYRRVRKPEDDSSSDSGEDE